MKLLSTLVASTLALTVSGCDGHASTPDAGRSRDGRVAEDGSTPALDGGADDAGRRDGGAESGAPDAASSTDAGAAADGGSAPSDGGWPDAGSSDAGSTDAGPPAARSLVLDDSALVPISALDGETSFTLGLEGTPSGEVAVELASADPDNLVLGDGDCAAPSASLRVVFAASSAATRTIAACGAGNLRAFGGGPIRVSAEVDDAATADPAYHGARAETAVRVRDTRIVHVRETATGSGDGSRWADAMGGASTLDAIVDAATAEGKAVWVANGRYTAATPGASVLDLPSGARVYGGFEGDELYLDERPDPMPAPGSILDGDFAGDDDSTGETSDNSAQVVQMRRAILDGFTVRRGGRGVAVSGAYPVEALDPIVLAEDGAVLAHLLVTENRATRSGGGIGILSSRFPDPPLETRVRIADTVVLANRAGTSGAGIHHRAVDGHGELSIERVIVAGNHNDGSAGAGIWTDAPLALRGSVLFGNRVAFGTDPIELGASGGNFYASSGGEYSHGALIIEDTAIIRGGAREGGGVSLRADGLTARIHRTSFWDNVGRDNVAALYLLHERSGGGYTGDLEVEVRDSEFRDNVLLGGCGTSATCTTTINAGTDVQLRVRNSAFRGNRASNGVGFGSTVNMAYARFGAIVNTSFFDNFNGVRGNCRSSVLNTGFWANGAHSVVGDGPGTCTGIVLDHIANPAGTVFASFTNGVLLETNPYDLGTASGELFLLQADNPSVDFGQSAHAEAADIPWTELTTRADLSVPVPNPSVDVGRHYDPGHPVVERLEIDATGHLAWNAPRAVGCTLLEWNGAAPSLPREVPPAASSETYPTTSGHTFYLICRGISVVDGGGLHTVARVQVP